MNIAFLTVIYPGVESFLPDFFRSLQNQTRKDFDVYIFNDGVASFEQKFRSDLSKLNAVVVNVSSSPVKNREIAINHILDTSKYDAIIFGDSDDYFSENRVENSANLLSEYDVVLNDLVVVDDCGEEFINEGRKGRFSEVYSNLRQMSAADICLGNAFGLSNTGIRTDAISKVKFPENLVALDWFFFTRLLLKGCRSIFTNECCTYYRQHSSNTVGMKGMTAHGLLEEVRVKMLHYEELSRAEMTGLATGFAFDELHRSAANLYKRLKNDETLLHSYYDKLMSKNNNSPLWWGNAVLTEIQ